MLIILSYQLNNLTLTLCTFTLEKSQILFFHVLKFGLNHQTLLQKSELKKRNPTFKLIQGLYQLVKSEMPSLVD